MDGDRDIMAEQFVARDELTRAYAEARRLVYDHLVPDAIELAAADRAAARGTPATGSR